MAPFSSVWTTEASTQSSSRTDTQAQTRALPHPVGVRLDLALVTVPMLSIPRGLFGGPYLSSRQF